MLSPSCFGPLSAAFDVSNTLFILQSKIFHLLHWNENKQN